MTCSTTTSTKAKDTATADFDEYCTLIGTIDDAVVKGKLKTVKHFFSDGIFSVQLAKEGRGWSRRASLPFSFFPFNLVVERKQVG